MNLDHHSSYRTVDAEDALADVEATAEQWRKARALAVNPLELGDVENVLITGMGGSGICGDICWALSQTVSQRPMIVHKGYGLPGFVDDRTLVIVASYSGATEETLSAFKAALQRGARCFAITSGGELGDLCDRQGVPWARIPGGGQPRHSLGYLLVPTLVALGLDADLDEAIDVMESIAGRTARSVAASDNHLKQLAQQLASATIPIVLAERGIGSLAAYRLKCQLNENAKLPAVYGELPEANHNEIVAWQQTTPLTGRSGLVVIRDRAGEHPRVTHRFDITRSLMSEQLAWDGTLDAEGHSMLARAASLLLQADLVSLYTALARDVDPTPIPSIDRLKAALAGAS